MDSIITKQAAKVISVNGNAFIKVNGKDVPIAEFLDLNVGTEIFIPEGANALLSLEDGTMLPVGEQDSPAQDFLDSPLDDEIAAIQALIEDGVDPTEVLEATAAGGTPTSSGSQAPEAIARIGEETIAQAGFDTTEIIRGFNTFTPSRVETTQVDSDIQPEIVVFSPTSTVSEGQPAVFTIALAFEGQAVSLTSSLTLSVQPLTGGDFSAESEDLGELEYFDGTSWQPIVGGQITLPAGQGSIQVRVNTVNEDGTPVYEGLENFGLIVSEVVVGTSPSLTSNGEVGVTGEASVVDDRTGSVTEGVVSDDDRPTLTVSNAGEISEGNDVVFAVSLSNPVDGSLNYKFSLQNAGIERDDITGVTINDGEPLTSEQIDLLFSGGLELNIDGFDTLFNVVLNTNPDSVFEGDESFELNVESVVGSQVISDSGSATISDDGVIDGEPGGDSDIPTLTVSGGGEINEGKNIVFDVKLTKAVDGDVTYAFSLGNAQIDADDIEGITVNGTPVDIGAFLAGNITAAIDGSQQSFKVVIDTKGDKVFEGDESFTLNVSADTGITVDGQSGNLILNGDANATVSDDGTTHGKPGNDDRPELTVTGGGEVNEGKNIVFDVKLTKAVDGDVTYAFSLGNAQIDADDIEGITVNGTPVDIGAFLAGNITAAIDGSQQSFKVVIDTKGDKVFEGDESFTLNVSADTGITVDGDNRSLVLTGNQDATISDDGVIDDKPGGDSDIPALTVTGGGEVSEGQDITFNVDLSNKVAGQVTYTFGIDQNGVERGDITGMTINGKALTTDDIDDVFAGTYTLDISGGNTNFDVVFNTRDDQRFEGDESFTLNVSADTGITVDGQSGNLILNGDANATVSDDGTTHGKPGNDDRPELTVTGGGEINEGKNIVFDVKLTKAVDGDVTYAFSLDNAQIDADDIEGITVNGTPVDIGAFLAGNITAAIDGSQQSFKVVIDTKGDKVFEGDESFTLNVSADTGITVDGQSGNLILNGDANATVSDDGTTHGKPGNDDRPELTVTGGGEVNEGKNIVFDVKLTKAVDGDVTYAFSLGNAQIDADDIEGITVNGTPVDIGAFLAGNITAAIDGSQQSFKVVIDTKGDKVFEGDESFTLNVSADTGITVDGQSGNLILNGDANATVSDDGTTHGKPGNDDRPELTVTGGGEINEGKNIVFDVKLTKAVDGDVTYAFSLGNAQIDADDIEGITVNGTPVDIGAFLAGNITAAIDGSQQSFKVVIDTKGDKVFEGDESFTLNVSADTGITVDGQSGNLILNGDANATVSDDGTTHGKPGNDDRPELTVTGGGEINEGKNIVFDVKLTKAVDGDVTYAFSLGNAQIDADDIEGITVNGTPVDIGAFLAGNITAAIDGSQQSFKVVIDTKGDKVFEGDESFTLNVSADTGITVDGQSGNLILNGDANATVSDDGTTHGKPGNDDRPELTVTGGGEVNEGKNIVFDVKLTKAVDGDVTYAFSLDNAQIDADDIEGITVNGTPVDIGAFLAGNITAAIDGSQQSFKVVIDTKGDKVFEGDESFTLNVSADTGITVDGQSGNLILNGDANATVSDDGTTHGKPGNDDRPELTVTGGGEVNEGKNIVFDVKLTKAVDGDVTYAFSLGNAQIDADDIEGITVNGTPVDIGAFLAGNITAAIDGSQQSFKVVIDTKGDKVFEGDESFTLNVSADTGITVDGQSGNLILNGDANATVSDDGTTHGKPGNDDRPELTVTGGGEINEGKNIVFDVKLTKAVDGDVTYAFSLDNAQIDADDIEGITVNGTPVDIGAFLAGNITAAIDGSQQSFKVVIDTKGDKVFEGDESFTLNVSADTGITVDGQSGNLILNGDANATVSDDGTTHGKPGNDDRPELTVTGGGEVNEGKNIVFDVKLTKAVDGDVTYAFSLDNAQIDADDIEGITVNGTPVDIGAFLAGNITAAIDGSQQSFKVVIDTKGDKVFEGDESFTLNVSADTGITVDGQSGNLILNGDANATVSDDGTTHGKPGNDDRPELTVTGGGEINEGKNIVFDVKLTKAVDGDVTYAFSLGNAQIDADDIEGITVNGTPVDIGAFLAGNITAAIDGSQQSFKVVIDTKGDKVFEGDESFTLNVSADTGITVDGQSGNLILNGDANATVSDDGTTHGKPGNDDRPELTVTGGGEVNEGKNIVFDVKLTKAVDGDVTYAFSLGNAQIDADDIEGITVNGTPVDIGAFLAGNITAAIDGSQQSFKVVIDTKGDKVFEGDESFTLNVSADTGITVDGQSGNLILNGDANATVSDDGTTHGKPGNDDRPELTVTGGGEVNEGKNIVFDVKLTKAVDGDVTYAFSLGNAQIDADDIEGITVNGTPVDIGAFLAGNITAAIDGSQQSFKVVIDTKGDKVFEGDESFTLNVSADTGITVDGQSGNLILNGDANATVSDDGTTHGKPGNDDRPELTVTGGGEVNEGKNIVFDVKLTKAVDGDVTYAFSLGNAQIDADDIEGITVNGTPVDIGAFLAGNITAAIDGSQQSFKVVIDTKGDKVFEGDESFTLNVSADTGITVDGDNRSLVLTGNQDATISDDGVIDDKPGGDSDIPALTVTGGGEVSEGQDITFNVDLSNKVAGQVTYTFGIDQNGVERGDITGMTINGKALTTDDIDDVFAGTYTLDISGGNTNFDVVFNTRDDQRFEGDESFTLNVSADTGITVDGDNRSLVLTGNQDATISDDGVIDGKPGGDSDIPALTVTGGGEVSEGQDITFNVDLSNKVAGQVTYTFGIDQNGVERGDITGMTINGKALTTDDIDDVFAGTYTLDISGGNTNFDVVFNTRDDQRFEGDESFTLNVSADTGITVDGDNRSLVLTGKENATISDDGNDGTPGNGDDDDDRPELTVTGGGEVNEGQDITFNVDLSNKVAGKVTYTFDIDQNGVERGDITGMTINGKTLTTDDIDDVFAGTYTLDIQGGNTNFDVVFNTRDDQRFEGDESFTLNVSADTGITVDGDNSSLVLTGNQDATISDDGVIDGKPGGDSDIPALTVTGGGEVNEGQDITFNVDLSNKVAGKVTYTFDIDQNGVERGDITGMTINGKALTTDDIDDVFAGTYTLDIQGGNTNFDVVFNTRDDQRFEGDENFTLNVSADTGITVDGDNSSLVLTGNQDATISDDGVIDGKPGGDSDIPALTVTGGGEVNEGQDITFNVDLSNKVAGKVTYTFDIDQNGVERGDITGMTINGKALTTDDIDDVFAGTYTLDIQGGNTNFDVVFNTRDDQRFEGDENFTLNVSADTGITVDGDNSSLVLTGNQDATISDDGVIDGKPGGDDDRLTISIEGNKEVSEGKIACYKITLDGQSDKEVTFKLALTEGTADSDDYGNVTVYFLNTYNKFEAITPDADGYYTVPAGVNQLLAYVDTKQDHVFEGDESFTLTVIPGENVKGITDNKSATAETIISDDGQINDKPGGDDDRPTLTVADAGEVAEGTNAIFDVALGNKVKGDVTYTFTLSGNSDNAADISRDIIGLTLTNQNGDAIDSVTVTMNPDGTYSATIDGSVTDFKVVVETNQDSAYEGNEGFKLDVSTNTPLATTGNDTSGVATIIDNDNPPVAIDDYKESNTLFQESFEFGNGSKGWVVVDEFNGWNITNGLEIQTGNVGGSTASDGSSHAELDSHGAVSSVEISRVLDSGDGVIAGQPYTLTFDFKPRPRHEDDSDMVFTFGDYSYKVIVSASKNISFEALQEGAPVITSSSAGNGWTTISVTYTAQDDAEIKLAFANDDETTNNDTYGAYIDNIEVNGPQPYWVNNSDAEGIFIAFTDIAHNDTDADEGDTVSVWNKDDLNSFVLVPSEAGSIELSDDGQGLVFKPNPDYNGPVQIEYFATDGTNKSLEPADIHIYVNEVNANDDGTGLVFETSSDDGWQNLDGNSILTISAVKIGENGQRVPQGDLVTENSKHVHNKHGIGVADEAREGNAGDVSYQVEYDHGTNTSEALELVLTSAAEKLEIGIARLFQNEHGQGNHEVAKWTAYGEDGQVIATGEFNFGDRTSGKGVITIEAEGIYKVVLEALPRVNETGSDKTSGDSSDFTITSVAVYSDQAKYTVTETETLDSKTTAQGSLLDNDGDPEGHSFKVTEVNGKPLEVFDADGFSTVIFDEGTLNINGVTGEFSFTANDREELGKGETDTFTFNYTIKDAKGDTDTAKVYIDIIGKENTPVEPKPTYDNKFESGSGNDTYQFMSSHNLHNISISSPAIRPNDYKNWIKVDDELYENANAGAIDINVLHSEFGQPVLEHPYNGHQSFINLIDTDDFINSGGGNDNVEAGGGNDTIWLGDSGNEPSPNDLTTFARFIESEFTTGHGDQAQPNTDFLINGEDSNFTGVLTGDPSADIAHGQAGDDVILGQAGIDVIFGGSGQDKLDGGTSNDFIRGGSGNDTIIGGAGKDLMRGDSGKDTFVWTRDHVDLATDSQTFTKDTIVDFNATSTGKDKDTLDISGLLQDNSVITLSGDDSGTTISIDIDGDGYADQLIVLENTSFKDVEGVIKNGMFDENTTARLSEQSGAETSAPESNKVVIDLNGFDNP
ncbi:hypothetical protein K6Q96_13895 [Grimontia kaedaensis]|uniref:Immunoglobulin domain-containing protein n=1 Tax=Grimontia kaedaensis TaxID=2872157 RepID=A0ABY4WS15_9GAMM|nr:Calx-beta domain-containing protein [Grimontia kaedaensis]USH01947.1 hypothetical protein K6Q96_13895 [Grimontia kaedaensis]